MINYLKVKNIFKDIDPINSTLLIAQAKKWIDKENYDGFRSFFSCKNSNDIIGECHQCGRPADKHLDCGNEACHILFIQCDKCYKEYDGCCTKECKDFASLPIEEQRILRKDPEKVVSQTRYSSRVKPKLTRINQS